MYEFITFIPFTKVTVGPFLGLRSCYPELQRNFKRLIIIDIVGHISQVIEGRNDIYFKSMHIIDVQLHLRLDCVDNLWCP